MPQTSPLNHKTFLTNVAPAVGEMITLAPKPKTADGNPPPTRPPQPSPTTILFNALGKRLWSQAPHMAIGYAPLLGLEAIANSESLSVGASILAGASIGIPAAVLTVGTMATNAIPHVTIPNKLLGILVDAGLYAFFGTLRFGVYYMVCLTSPIASIAHAISGAKNSD